MFWSPDSIKPEDVPPPRLADVDQLFGDVGRLNRLDWPPMEMQARFGKFLLRLAEAQFNRKFVRLHRIDRLENPEREHRSRDQAEKRRAGAAAARQCLLQPVLAAADDVLEIGGRSLRAAGPRGP